MTIRCGYRPKRRPIGAAEAEYLRAKEPAPFVPCQMCETEEFCTERRKCYAADSDFG